MKNTDRENERKQSVVLGIDTSNYKTSVAVASVSGTVLADCREFLKVKQGERGLRQSDALFQHIDRLPSLLAAALPKENAAERHLVAVAVSTRPRPQEGSYMPVFKAGVCVAEGIALAAGVPLYEFSHQEGHLAAAVSSCAGTENLNDGAPFLAYHLSGGTCELLLAAADGARGYRIELIGGTKDISFGQVIDRVGVQLGFPFPAGEALDELALAAQDETRVLKGVSISGLYINLSGIDSQCRRAAAEIVPEDAYPALVRELFTRIGQAVVRLTEKAAEETGVRRVLFSGGVSGSRYLRNLMNRSLQKKNIAVFFGTPALSQDNAVGTALLGVNAYGNETC